MNVKSFFLETGKFLKGWLSKLSFRTGAIVLVMCITFYIISFAQMALPISTSAKGVLWVIFFGLAKTAQYGGLTILGAEGIKRFKAYWQRNKLNMIFLLLLFNCITGSSSRAESIVNSTEMLLQLLPSAYQASHELPSDEDKQVLNPVWNVRDFGAKGDGEHIDSPAFNAALMEAAQKGGGTVIVPAGTYQCYSIHLQSNVTLQIDKGAIIKAAPATEEAGYDEAEHNDWTDYQDFGHSHWHNSLLWGENLHNVVIEGGGLIDGSNVLTRGSMRRNSSGRSTANKALALRECQNVTIRNLQFLNCGHFALLLTGVDNLIIEGLTIDTNRDGIDIDCCENVTVRDCRVNTVNDDAIVLKCSYALGYPKPTSNAVIEDCDVSGYDIGSLLDGSRTSFTDKAPDGDGPTGRIKLGTESNGGFRNITIRRCTFNHCRGLALETVDGAAMENIEICDLTMHDICNSPLYIRLGSRMRAPEGFPASRVDGIRIHDIKVTDADSRYACLIAGVPGNRIRNVQIEDISVEFRGGLTLDDVKEQRGSNPFFFVRDGKARINRGMEKEGYPEPSAHGIQPAWGFSISNADDIELKRIRLICLNPDERPWLHHENTHNLQISDIFTVP